METIILASASPRRRQLLEVIGLPHKVMVSQTEETFSDQLEPEEVAEDLAHKKAAVVAAQLSEGLVIGADTIVVLDGRILGKPSSENDAADMLRDLRGKAHQVVTGLAVIDVRGQKTVRTHEKTQVTFKDVSEEDIIAYVETGEPMDKAGAYGIQELGGLFVKGIRGCYFNVVGLPVPLLADVLKEFGINILQLQKSCP